MTHGARSQVLPSAPGVAAPGNPVPARNRWARRRAMLTWRRRAEAATAWLLASLVALSVALGALLWTGSPALQRPLPAGGSGGYVAAEALGTAGGPSLIVPQRIIVFFPGGPDIALGDPAANPLYLSVWGDVRALLEDLTPRAVGAAAAAGPKEAALAVAGRRPIAAAPAPARTSVKGAPAAPAGPATAVEVDFGPIMSWKAWWQFLGNGSAWYGTPGPLVDRVDVVLTTQATQVFLLSGYGGVEALLPPAAGSQLLALLGPQQNQPQPAGYMVQPLPPVPGPTFAVDPGIEVPVSPAWQAVGSNREAIDPQEMAAAVFPDPLAVRAYPQPDGSISFTGPQHWVLNVNPAAGSADFVGTATAAAPAAAGTWVSSLLLAARYVDREGGWPPSAWLASVEAGAPAGRCPLGGCAAASFAFAFDTRFEGLPVLGDPAAIALAVSAAGVTAYDRHVALPGSALSGAAQSWITPGTALTMLEQQPPPSLPQDGMQVEDVFAAWAPLPAADLLEPAWAVRLLPATGGTPRIVLIDALRGQVLAVLSGG